MKQTQGWLTQCMLVTQGGTVAAMHACDTGWLTQCMLVTQGGTMAAMHACDTGWHCGSLH